jgi:glycosyltransferase 2 family protein
MSSPSLPPPKTHFLKQHGVKLFASALIGLGLVAMLHKAGMSIIPPGEAFAHVQWWTLPTYILTLVGMNYFRATRWRFLLRAIVDVPRKRILVVSWVGFAAILLMPFRIGEFVRPYMLKEGGPGTGRDGKPREISMTMATGSVVAERVTDGLYVSIVLAIALLVIPTVQPLPMTVVGLGVPVERVRQAGFGMLGLFTFAFGVLAVFYFARDWARRTTLAIWGIVSRPLGERLAGMAEKAADGLHVMGNPRDAVPFLLETTAYWGLNVGGMWLLAWGCGVVHADGSAITFGETCALMGMLTVTIWVPGPPGLLGVFQLGIYAGMTMYYPTSIVTGPGAAYVFLMYVSQFLWTVVGGAGGLWFQRGALRALQRAERDIEGGGDDDKAAA